jgi:hypothetical protein
MAREVPQVYPRFGYLLDHNGAPPGVLLAVYSPPDRRTRPSGALDQVDHPGAGFLSYRQG